jgi:hypothetical protein
MTRTTGDNKRGVSIRAFFSNPIVGIVGSIASVVGLVLAVYFYHESAKHRELTYLVHPAKAIIVKAGQLTRLSVSIDGRQLSTDVTAAQIAFWNAGKEPIRSDHVLREFTISTQPSVPIIDATVRKSSREVCHIKLDTSREQAGELRISWNILEHNDGGIVQVVFGGDVTTKLLGSVVIEGQPSIHALHAASKASAEERYAKENRSTRIVALFAGSLGLVVAIFMWPLIPQVRRLSMFGESTSVVLTLFVAMPLLLMGLAVFGWFFFRVPEPPFGF